MKLDLGTRKAKTECKKSSVSHHYKLQRPEGAELGSSNTDRVISHREGTGTEFLSI